MKYGSFILEVNNHRQGGETGEEVVKGEPALQRLKSLRDAQGLSQEILAEKLGVCPRQISRWETRDITPRNPVVRRRLCEILRCTWHQLLGVAEAA